MKLFVTGGAGFIGSNFIRCALKSNRNYSVVNYDKLTYAANLANLKKVEQDPRYRFVKGDVCDASAVETAIRGCDAVIHFAAESHVDRSIYEPTPVIETNITGTFVLLQIAQRVGIKRFVYISTDEVYGDLPPGIFAHEKSALKPSSPYAASKAAADLLVLSFVRTYGVPALVTRSSNNYGPHQFPEKFLPLLISNALVGKPLPIYGDGMQQRDWLYVDDNCGGILAALERGRIGEIYNLGVPDIEENLRMAKRILRAMSKPETLLSFVKDRPGHDRRYALDSTRAEQELSWQRTISLDEGLRRTIEWYESNHDWLASVNAGEYRSYYEKYYENRDSSLRAIARAEPKTLL